MTPMCVTPTGGLPSAFTKPRKRTFHRMPEHLFDAFWKLCKPKFNIQPDLVCESCNGLQCNFGPLKVASDGEAWKDISDPLLKRHCIKAGFKKKKKLQ